MVKLKNQGHFYYKGKLKNSWLARFFLHHTGTVDVGTVYTPCCIRNVLELLENSHLCPIYIIIHWNKKQSPVCILNTNIPQIPLY